MVSDIFASLDKFMEGNWKLKCFPGMATDKERENKKEKKKAVNLKSILTVLKQKNWNIENDVRANIWRQQQLNNASRLSSGL